MVLRFLQHNTAPRTSEIMTNLRSSKSSWIWGPKRKILHAFQFLFSVRRTMILSDNGSEFVILDTYTNHVSDNRSGYEVSDNAFKLVLERTQCSLSVGFERRLENEAKCKTRKWYNFIPGGYLKCFVYLLVKILVRQIYCDIMLEWFINIILYWTNASTPTRMLLFDANNK